MADDEMRETFGRRFYGRLLAGAFAGALLAAVVSIAVDTGYEAQTLAGGRHLHQHFILVATGLAALVGGLLNACRN